MPNKNVQTMQEKKKISLAKNLTLESEGFFFIFHFRKKGKGKKSFFPHPKMRFTAKRIKPSLLLAKKKKKRRNIFCSSSFEHILCVVVRRCF